MYSCNGLEVLKSSKKKYSRNGLENVHPQWLRKLKSEECTAAMACKNRKYKNKNQLKNMSIISLSIDSALSKYYNYQEYIIIILGESN